MLFFRIMLTEFIAEMGDKTQLMLTAMTSKYQLRDIILGTAAAILVLNGLAVLAGGLLGELIPMWLVRLIAAAAFLYFAIASLQSDGEDEEENTTGRASGFAPLTVFLTFFMAELGDKTQLTAVTFGANEGLQAALTVWLACSVGLFAADILGMLVGLFIRKQMSGNFLNRLAFCIFTVYGFLTLRQGLGLIAGERTALIRAVLAAAAIVFAVACFVTLRRNKEDI